MRSRKVFFFYCFSALLLCTDVLVHTLICILLTLSNSHTRYFHSKLSMVLFNLQINFTVCCTLRGSVCIRVLISFANSGPRARPIRKKYMRLQRRTVSMKAIGLFCLLCRVFFFCQLHSILGRRQVLSWRRIITKAVFDYVFHGKNADLFVCMFGFYNFCQPHVIFFTVFLLLLYCDSFGTMLRVFFSF